jgi:hypothetical protein
MLANDLSATRHADRQSSSSIGADHHSVVDGIDGGLPILRLLAGRGLEDRTIPHGADGIGTTRRGHASCVGAVLVGGDERGDEWLPCKVWPFIRVGVGEDLVGETFRPVVADVVTLTSVVLVFGSVPFVHNV